MQKLVLIILIFLYSIKLVSAGGQEGGGGGYVHDNFIFYGKEVLYYLKFTKEGQKHSSRYKIDLCRLKHTLNENLIYVYKDGGQGMFDNRGSLVDAFTYRWAIYLSKKPWQVFFEKKINIYHLVYKEMLRSEGTHFFRAIDISADLKGLQLNSMENWDEFLRWFENIDNTCLQDNELAKIATNISNQLLFVKFKPPRCLNHREIHEEHYADYLIRNAKETKCVVIPSKCTMAIREVEDATASYLIKSIYWKSQAIYNLPLVVINKSTGEKQRFFKNIANDLMQFKMEDLARANICNNKIERTSEIPKYLTLRSLIPEVENLGFEFLRKDGFQNCRWCAKSVIGYLGMGSKVMLLDQDIISAEFNAKFIKIKVLTNTYQKKSNDKFLPARVGSIGWITLSATDYMYYFNEKYKILHDR